MHEPVKEIPFIDTSCGSFGGHNDLLRPAGESPAAEHVDKNLQLYLTAPPDGFAALCRKFTTAYFPRGMILHFIMHNDECADILASVYPKGRSRLASPSAAHPELATNTILFRFFRSQEVIEKQALLDFHSRVRELRADRGVCITAGSYSKKARDYTTGMRFDLLEQKEFLAVLGIEKMLEVDCGLKAMSLLEEMRKENSDTLITGIIAKRGRYKTIWSPMPVEGGGWTFFQVRLP
ncbi:MAG: restriction endonuclease [Treponema sp.]|nr:restriction endonuclease [Treponema sp.]